MSQQQQRFERYISSLEEDRPLLNLRKLPEFAYTTGLQVGTDKGFFGTVQDVFKNSSQVVRKFTNAVKQFKRACKAAFSLLTNTKRKPSSRSPRRACKSAKSKSSSGSSGGSDPDPESSYSSLFPVLNQVIAFFIFISSLSFMPFAAASTFEVAK